MSNAETPEPIKLDYTLKTMEERAALVDRITSTAPKSQLTPRYLEILADYIIDAASKEDKKETLTKNRMVTINKRETSFEGLAEKFENGEDGLYSLMTEDKNIIFQPKMTITPKDIAEVPGLAELRQSIDAIEALSKIATGRRKYLLKKQLIEMRKDQYILKNAYRTPMQTQAITTSRPAKIDLSERKWVDENGEPQSSGLVSFFNPKHISAILCNYNGLKLQTAGHYWDDFFYLMEDFDNLRRRSLAAYPLYDDLIQCKIDGKQNAEIQQFLYDKYGVKHSVEYISSLWRNKIPEIMATYAQDEFLLWYYQNEAPEKAKWKRCSRCGQIKLAHNRFFSKNNTSKDGFYSICKACRNAPKKIVVGKKE